MKPSTKSAGAMVRLLLRTCGSTPASSAPKCCQWRNPQNAARPAWPLTFWSVKAIWIAAPGVGTWINSVTVW